MKLSLVVLSEGKLLGKTIPITLSQFIIGRDPQCQLRPASALISKRHCALITRAGKVYVRDFDSTNGTFVNEQPLKGECEIKHDDTLKVGPLTFRVVVEGAAVPVNKPTPLPKVAAKGASDDDSVAAMLMDIVDDSNTPTSEGESVPGGSTVMEAPTPVEPQPALNGERGEAKAEGEGEGEGEKAAKAEGKPPDKGKKSLTADTSSAAQALLQKYMRRQR